MSKSIFNELPCFYYFKTKILRVSTFPNFFPTRNVEQPGKMSRSRVIGTIRNFFRVPTRNSEQSPGACRLGTLKNVRPNN